MKYWKVNSASLGNSRYEDNEKVVKAFFKQLKSKTKRKIHIKSKFFDKEKIFFDHFWKHLFQKPISQRRKRIKLFPCGIELVKYSTSKPEIKINPNKKREIFYRFFGQNKNKERFAVQIKENKTSKTKQLMSIFPLK